MLDWYQLSKWYLAHLLLYWMDRDTSPSIIIPSVFEVCGILTVGFSYEWEISQCIQRKQNLSENGHTSFYLMNEGK